MIYIKQGLDLPIDGEPEQNIHGAESTRSVAALGVDYVGLKPKLAVAVGDEVAVGDVLWRDRSNSMLACTSPAGGKVSAIHRGYKRTLLSVVIDVAASNEPHQTYGKYSSDQLDKLDAATVREQLQNSGMWSALRTRPYARVPAPDAKAPYIFVNAMDTNPLSADPEVVVSSEGNREHLMNGLRVLQHMCEEAVYLCRAASADIPPVQSDKLRLAEFVGPHPAGLSGTHIHYLAPAGRERSVWTIGYQDVIAIGYLFTQGRIMTERVVSLAGPAVKSPRLLRTRVGADLNELCVSELEEGENRIISGSVLSGRTANASLAYLGRYHQQVSVLAEDRERVLMGWMSPGWSRHSQMPIYLHGVLALLGRVKKLPLSTSTHGSERAMVPTGNYERVMPLDLVVTPLLRYLIVGDLELAEQLGCLELDEEDLALCSYVCSAKYEYGHILRTVLERIRLEG